MSIKLYTEETTADETFGRRQSDSVTLSTAIDSVHRSQSTCEDMPRSTDPLVPKCGQSGRRPMMDLFKGIFYGGGSSIFFVISTVIVKLLTDVSPSELAIFRFIGILACSIPLVLRQKLKHPEQSLFGPGHLFPTIILRGVMGASSLLLRFYAYRHLPLADASVIIFSVPVFVTLTAHIFLNVSVDPIDWHV
jgi:uncharacterized membrane protein